MLEVQVVLSARGVGADELAPSVRSLLQSVRTLRPAPADSADGRMLEEHFGGSVRAAGALRPGVPLLVVPAGVVVAWGAIRRLRAHTEVPGRCVTRVFLPGSREAEFLACWSTSFLRLYEGSLDSLVDADLSFDRAQLSPASPKARSWLPAPAVGVAVVGEVGDDLASWSRRTGMALEARQVWASTVRGPAGGVKRRLARRRHRRRGVDRTRSVR